MCIFFRIINTTRFFYNKIIDFLNKGDNDVLPLSGFDEEYDNFVLEELCSINYSERNTHMQYRCVSLNSAYSLAFSFIDAIVKSEEIKGRKDLNEAQFLNLFHLINSHILIRSRKVSDLINNLAEKEIISYQNLLIQILIVVIIFSIIAFIFMLRVPFFYDNAYSGAKSLLRRLPPEAVIHNMNLHNYILSQSSSSKQQMSLGQTIIYESLSPILIVGVTQHIESANPAVTKTLGFRPEELIGQPLSSIICEADQENINRFLTLLRLGESRDFCLESINCVTDANILVPTSMTILGMRKSSQADLNSFVILLRDETILQSQQKEVEEAKQKSEELLYEILPRDIVVRINKGEKNVNFSVEFATIMFIDIDKFSEFSKFLLPAQILGSLSTIFGLFDTLIKNYPTISKIKIIGDIYMCAAGLFHPNDPPQNAALDTVHFGFDCLQAIEDYNDNFDSELSIRIGINSGRPIIAGILGTYKSANIVI
jgi:class 3 adenylate cyclase